MARTKCINPSCSNIFVTADIHYKGGINDKGGLIVKCKKCGEYTPIITSNPDEHYGVDGGTIEDKWDDEYPDYFDRKYNIKRFGEQLIIKGDAVPRDSVQWHESASPFFANDINYEVSAYQELKSASDIINEEYYKYYNFYVKSRETANKSFVVINYINDAKPYRAIFSKKIDSEKDLNVKNLYFIDHSNMDIEKQIDGIYTRDQAKIFLERCLNRWSALCNEIIIATPFIGLNYNKAQMEEVVRLWNWLDANTDIKKTQFITRKNTFNLLKKSQNHEEVTFDLLREWDLLGDLQDAGANGEMTFYQKFHAKFYAGIFNDRVEMLSGSFNIHTGDYYENLTFKNYNKEHFKERYIRKINPSFNYQGYKPERVHYIEINIDGPFINKTMGLVELIALHSL